MPTSIKKKKLRQKPNITKWRQLYNELINVYSKSRALEIIGSQYGVSRQTALYHLFPDYKSKQKKYFSKTWTYEKQNPVIHKKRISYKAKYMSARYHIDDLIRKSYQQAAPNEMMTIEDLAYAIEDISGILFQPSTILNLSDRFEATKGYPLLTSVPGHQMTRYKLSQQAMEYA